MLLPTAWEFFRFGFCRYKNRTICFFIGRSLALVLSKRKLLPLGFDSGGLFYDFFLILNRFFENTLKSAGFHDAAFVQILLLLFA